ncbi:hypothetical protein C471_00450 [Halorubrum saccharovorum DSM 1137]|uniref:Intracellular proteinase inhibitor BsuPI domain-containing protein n=1 Tax=Halorubrum saccharovorum DSM 1137 TaxID=1227484 RepID=M0E720_9EURY|nr:BsuPI-related putative proteinase inhibitor [Halorubrum saccharovorum]ELZ43540.1 hypothetical protein C471_00450 [Halorubrum saccharovorum DSM 1137]
MLNAALTAHTVDARDDAGGDDAIDLALTVRNGGDDPDTLRFRTGQRADFAAYRIGGEGEGDDREGVEDHREGEDDPVWRYGTGRVFTQVLGSETLEPGESTTYEATWGDPPAGRYRIVGEVTAEESDLTASAVARTGP